MQLQIEKEALKKEKDDLSKKRIDEINEKLDKLKEKEQKLRNDWEDEKNISDFVDALVLGNIAEDLMGLEVLYTMEYHKACGMSLHDQSLSLYNFYNDLSDYIFSNTKDIVEKNFADTGNIIKFIEEEEKRLCMERDLKESTSETNNEDLPKQKVLSPNNDKK